MATVDDVREIALALPGVTERVGGHTGEPSWRLPSGQIAWVRGPSKVDLRQLADLGLVWPDGPVHRWQSASPHRRIAVCQGATMLRVVTEEREDRDHFSRV